jgi:hypothetical protein
MNLERRIATELRAAGRKLSGYAATFGTEARIADFTEIIRPGAFSASLEARQDILALVDHAPGRLLARTKSGTLRLSEDDKGLSFEIDLPDTQDGRDILALAERGDLGGMSFGFLVPERGDVWKDGNRRELVRVDLREISVVMGWPAYPETEVHARTAKPALVRAYRFLETCKWGF